MKTEDIKKMAQAWKEVQEASYGKKKMEASDTQMGTITVKTDAERKARAQAYRDKKAETNEAMDPVNPKELKGKHKDRKDKDINNDGKVDSTDKYLHARRKAVSAAIKGKKKDQEVEVQTSEGKLPPALQAYMDKKKGKKPEDKKADMKEAATHKPGVASPAGEGLSPNAKKELARKTPMPDFVNEPKIDKKTFDSMRASGKKAKARNGDNQAGDKNVINKPMDITAKAPKKEDDGFKDS